MKIGLAPLTTLLLSVMPSRVRVPGEAANVAEAQRLLLVRAKANSQASVGQYEGGAEGSTQSLFVANYTY